MTAPAIQDGVELIEAERQLATISKTPPRTLAGAAVKLRLLCSAGGAGIR